VDLRNNDVIVQGTGFRNASGLVSFSMVTQDPFITGSVTSLPTGVTGEFITGSTFIYPLKAGPFQFGYET
jgi:predicted phage gp36 major capsid-like protein